MNLLPEKDKSHLDFSSSQVNFVCNPGRMMFFHLITPHQFTVDMGYEPFRFIHWNCQAILKSAVNYFNNKNVIQKNKYLVLKVLSKEFCSFIYDYFLMKKKR